MNLNDQPIPENPFLTAFEHLPTFENGRTPVHLTEAQFLRAKACWCMCEGLPIGHLQGLNTLQVVNQLQAEIERLNGLINTPQTEDFLNAVRLEAAHQQERWRSNQDTGKTPLDWFWLLGYLGGKAVNAFNEGNPQKGMHHIISTSAAMLNWFRQVKGKTDGMRPGFDPVQKGLSDAEEHGNAN